MLMEVPVCPKQSDHHRQVLCCLLNYTEVQADYVRVQGINLKKGVGAQEIKL